MGLMQLLAECENHLGWQPTRRPGDNIYKARAITYRVMAQAMEREGYTEGDIALAIAYCRLKRIPVSNPLALLGMVKDARKITGAKVHRPGSLDARQAEAIAWEQAHPDAESSRWIARITRSVAEGLTATLEEWAGTGRGR